MLGIGVCLALGGTVIAAKAWPVPDSGQTISYAAGDHGDYLLHPPAYTKLGANDVELADTATTTEGWVATRDNVTGLTWQIAIQGSTFNGLQDVVDAANAAKVGGHADWRAPAIRELQSIVNYAVDTPAIDQTFFPSTGAVDFWSPGTDGSSLAWYVNFSNGYVYYYIEDSTMAVRLVRGEPWFGFLSAHGNGTVSDAGSGLMWQQGEATPEAVAWDAALSQCQGLALGGYDDWRLPTAKELLSIVDFGRYFPVTKQTAFPNTQSSGYWSSTTNGSNTSEAWGVDFSDGYLGSSAKTSNYYVRCVRSGADSSTSLGGGLVPLTSGWNLAGLSTTEQVAVTKLGPVTSVWKWTTANGPGTWAVYLPLAVDKGAAYAATKGFGQFTTIKPGEGFWVSVP
jgi:hypothetical protein